MQELLNELTAKFEEFKKNAEGRISGTKAAGLRSRKLSKAMEPLFLEWRRVTVQADKEK